MRVNIIVAFCKNLGIGLNNQLCWNIKSDLIKFSSLTRGNGKNAIVMGRNTYLSLPKKTRKNDNDNDNDNDNQEKEHHSLYFRDNLILSSTLNMDFEEEINGRAYYTKTFVGLSSLVEYCESRDYDNIWVIGGESIYRLFMDEKTRQEIGNYSITIDKIHTTELHADFSCDTFFPVIDTSQYKCIQQDLHNEKFWSYYGYKIYDKIYKRKQE